MVAFFAGMTFYVPNVRSDAMVIHDNGNLDLTMLTDFGRILMPLTWNDNLQVVQDDPTNFGFMGLVLDHDAYDHTPGSLDIADSYRIYGYVGSDDFRPNMAIHMELDETVGDGTIQKSYCTFWNDKTSYPDDIRISQTVWTVKDKDWAIMQWTLKNKKSVNLTNIAFGLEIPLSQDLSSLKGGLGGENNDNGDDIDGYNSTHDVYWAQDTSGSGAGTTIGFGSAMTSDPITHYYSADYADTYTYDEYKKIYENDTWLYNRLRAPNTVVGSTPGNRSSTVGWNGFDLLANASRTFNLVIAINNSFDNMITAYEEAQYTYYNKLAKFLLTEFSDSDSTSQKIEIFNYGRPTTDLDADGYFFSVDGGVSQLTGNWANNPIPNREYAVFTVTGGTIGPEGDTIGLYQDLGGGNILLIEEVGYGQEGSAFDPLKNESTARQYLSIPRRYTNEWHRNSTASGPTWGFENSNTFNSIFPQVLINRVMFNPQNPIEGYIELMYTGSSSIDISGHKIVCDSEFSVPSGTVLDSTNRFYVLTPSNYPLNFDLDDGSVNGDNIYLLTSNYELMDMVGWSSSHTPGRFMSRMPDGSGTRRGYNDISSQDAGWVFDKRPSILITEFYVDSTTAKIEICYPRGGYKDTSSLSLMVDSGVLTGNWVPPIILGGGYSIFTAAAGTYGDEGDTIRLFHLGSILMDEVSYGTSGLAPDPLFGESTARIWDNSLEKYGNDFTRNSSLGPTFNTKNDVPPHDKIPDLVLNEVYLNSSIPTDKYIELFLKKGTLDISGFKIVGDSEIIIPNGAVLTPYDPYFYLIYPGNSSFFNLLDISGDNIYLYNSTGSLLDMVGWSSPFGLNTSMSRIPRGSGTHDGFDNPSSILAGWVFGSSPTFHYVIINTDTKLKGGKVGNTLYFNLSILNKQTVDDTFDIFNFTLNGYEVEIFDETGTFKISEIFIPANTMVNITVSVLLPSSMPLIDRDNITIIVQSQSTLHCMDNISLISVLYTQYYWILGQFPHQSHVYLYARNGANVTFGGTKYLPTTIYIPPDEFRSYNIGDMEYEVENIGIFSNERGWYFLEMYSYNPIMVNFDRAFVLKTGPNLFEWKHGDQLHNMPPDKLSTIYYLPKCGSGAGDDRLIMFSHEPATVTIKLLWNAGGGGQVTVVVDGIYVSDYLEGIFGGTTAGYSLTITSDHPIAAAAFDEQAWWPNPVWLSGIMIAGAVYTELFDEYMHVHNNPTTEYQQRFTPTSNNFDFYDLNGNFVHARSNPIEASRIDLLQDVGYSGSPDPFLAHVKSTAPYADTALSPTKWFVDNVTAFMGWNASMGKLDIYTDSNAHISIFNGRNNSLISEFDMTAHSIFQETLEFVGFEADLPFLVVVASDVPTYTAVRIPYYVRPYTEELAPPVVIDPEPPNLYINTSSDKKDAVLYWDAPTQPGIEYYLIYRSKSQTDFDFTTVWKNTQIDKEPAESIPIPLRTTWNDTNAANPANATNYSQQYYYTIRAVNSKGDISRTSRTVGKWTKEFSQGVSSFSIPLEPFETITSDYYLWDMNATYLKWMDPSDHIWMKHGDGSVNNSILRLGEGYEVKFQNLMNYTFCGMPAAMINFDDDSGFSGFDFSSEAKSLDATVSPTGNVVLRWQEPAVMGSGDWYEVYYSNTRDGFFGTPGVHYVSLPSINYGNDFTIISGLGAHNPGSRLYFMLVPYNSLGTKGSGTYSKGIWTEEYLAEYDTIGIPLKMSWNESADWFCDNIPDSVGINYYIYPDQRWGWHSTRMPEGAFDPVILMTEGYQISTASATKFTFIGI
jgi:hypothetical protein